MDQAGSPEDDFNRDSIGIMEKKMETTIVYWGYIGVIDYNILWYIIVYYSSILWYIIIYFVFAKLASQVSLEPSLSFALHAFVRTR